MNQPTIISNFEPPRASIRNYVIGFLTCLILTLLAFDAVISNWFGRRGTIGFVAVLAVLQAAVQLRRFLHLGQEFKPRLRLMIFVLMLCIVLILVAGSLWIMTSLHSRMMLSPAQQNEYMQGQDGL